MGRRGQPIAERVTPVLKIIGPWVFTEDGLGAFQTWSGVALSGNWHEDPPDPRRPWRLELFRVGSPGESYTLGWVADQDTARAVLHRMVMALAGVPGE